MQSYRFFWHTHKWTGIFASLFVLLVAGTGFLLLLKKDVAWIQPPTQRGTERPLDEVLTLGELWERVAAQGHSDFRTPADIERIDVRLGRYVYKVRSKHNHSEIQIDAGTGAVLSVATRRSDFLESLHDGSFFGAAVHGYVLPVFAFSLVYLVFSGIWLWLAPVVRRHKKRRERAARTG